MDRDQLKRLTGLAPQSYEHPLDKKALNALESLPVLPSLVNALNEYGFERLLRIQLTGSNLRVTADNALAPIHDMVREASAILDVPRIPEVFVSNMGGIAAFTAGTVHPVVVLSSGAVDLLTDDELFFVIAHELGHIKSGHVRYYQMAQVVPWIAGKIGAATLGLGEAAISVVTLALLNWQRMSEFTADRAGLLAVQQIEPAIGAMMKIAGLPQKYFTPINSSDFLEQARSFEEFDVDKLSKFTKAISVMGATHPWTVLRAKQFLQWVESGEYVTVRDADHRDEPPAFCKYCANPVRPEVAFCTRCGAKVGLTEVLER